MPPLGLDLIAGWATGLVTAGRGLWQMLPLKALIPLFGVALLFGVGYLGTALAGLHALFGVWLPYGAIAVFLGGFVWRVLRWAAVPVPFRIPSTAGQQRSLPWIEPNRLDNPATVLGVVGRMLLEVLLFRSLIRNTRTRLAQDGRPIYVTSLWLWLGAMALHWSLLVILLRHLRLVTEPVPGPVLLVLELDGFLQLGIPTLQLTTVLFLLALLFLIARRLVAPRIRYLSLANDYFPLWLLLGIAFSGFLLRHVSRVDVATVKDYALGMVQFHPVPLASLDPLFYGHLFLVCVLLLVFPFSKLMHAGGVFFSPTRNLANNSRGVRHVNPWRQPVKVHDYAAYEDEFRDKMIKAEHPVEKRVH